MKTKARVSNTCEVRILDDANEGKAYACDVGRGVAVILPRILFPAGSARYDMFLLTEEEHGEIGESEASKTVTLKRINEVRA